MAHANNWPPKGAVYLLEILMALVGRGNLAGGDKKSGLIEEAPRQQLFSRAIGVKSASSRRS